MWYSKVARCLLSPCTYKCSQTLKNAICKKSKENYKTATSGQDTKRYQPTFFKVQRFYLPRKGDGQVTTISNRHLIMTVSNHKKAF